MANSVTSQLPIPIPLLSARDIMARLGNQASRPPFRSPPLVTPAQLADSRQPKRPSQPAKDAMASALTHTNARLEIHAIYDDKDTTQSIAGKPLTLTAPFNPAELEHVIESTWADLASPGSSIERSHYAGTKNQTFTFDLLLDYMVELQRVLHPQGQPPRDAGRPQQFPDAYVAKVAQAYNFLASLQYPKDGVSGPSNLHPPEILLYWPNSLSVHCTLRKFSAKWQKMLPTGHLASAMVSLTFKEKPRARIAFEDILVQGNLRPQPDQGTPAGDRAGSTANIG